MDYIKVNFYTDSFTIVDKVVDVMAPLSDVDHTLWDELHGLHLRSLATAVHVRSGVKTSADTEVQSHQPQEHKVQQFTKWGSLFMFDDLPTQETFINQMRNQLQILGAL